MFQRLRRICVLAALALGLGLAVASQGVAQTDVTLSDIRVEGNQRIEPETVKSYLRVRPGDRFRPDKVNESLKALFATGLFADVTLRREGTVLVVRVVENPIINRLAFEGNKRIEDETLQAEVQLRPRVVYTRTKVQNDVKRILDVYRRSGRFAATVVPKVIQLDQNRVDLVFEIDEGHVTGVRTITFVGNRAFGDSTLRREIATKESVWWRYFSADDNYDPDRLTYDRELLRRSYLNRGYADFRVVSAVAELAPDRQDFFITFTLEEGERYRFGVVDIVTQFEDLDVEALYGKLLLEEGAWYSLDKVTRTTERLAKTVEDLGYPFVDVQPIIDRDRESKEINVTFDIMEGERVFVERLEIVGNTRTLDKVIRREFRLVEGDAFSSAKLRRSIQRVNNLGFFKRVDFTQIPGSDPDKTIIQVEIEEQSTGELSFGAGYSTNDGALGEIALRERNLLGRGLDLRAKFRLTENGTEFDVGYTDPWFTGRPLAFGLDVFRISRDNRSESSFDLKAIGGSIRAGYEITEYLRQTWNYTARSDDVFNLKEDASLIIREQAGNTVTSQIGQLLSYDKLNSRLRPSEGFALSYSTEVAGIGGDVHLHRHEFKGQAYWTVEPDWKLVFGLIGSGGIVEGFNEDVRVNDRFFLGGDSFRGFEPAGIGPRDRNSQDALGGKQFYIGTAELNFPIYGIPEELGLVGRVFSEAGGLRGTDENEDVVQDTGSLRASVGAGIGWFSPFGPIRVEVARALLKEDFDKRQTLHFSFGTRF